MRVCVFCSASSRVPEKYLQTARQIGEMFGDAGFDLVYGGTNMGMMREVSQGVQTHGGKIIGVVPALFENDGRIDADLDEVIRCQDLADRKTIMIKESDVCVALPGGIGTMDEVFSAMASNTLGYHGNKIIFYDMEGFWSPLIGFLNRLNGDGFVKAKGMEAWSFASSPEELVKKISSL